MADHMFEQRSGIPSSPGPGFENKVVGKGKTKIPAGTFDVSKHQIVDANGKVYAEFEFSEDIHPFGVVTSATEDSSMTLMDYGTGAKSLITETPTMMSQPPGMPPGMPRGMPPGMEQQPPGMGPGSGLRELKGMGSGYEPER
jgi:hypothetical protein